MRRTTALLLVLAVSLTLCAAALGESTPAIYRVTDDAGHFIYLLGTYHIITQDDLPIAGADEILDECGALAMELDLSDNSVIATAGGIVETTGNDLPETTRARLEEFFSGRGMGMLSPMIPTLSASTLLLLVDVSLLTGPDPAAVTSPEAWLLAQAESRGLEIIGLETAEEQVQAVSDGLLIYTDEEADALLNMILDQAATLEASYAMIRMSWAWGDVEAMTLISSVQPQEGSKDETAMDVVITGRNDVFYDQVAGLLGNGGGVLVAVGSAHVFNTENGLLRRLAEAGYTVERWYPSAVDAPADAEAVPAE